MRTEDALTGYKIELASRDAAEGTVKLYYVYLNRFAAACPTLDELSRETVSAWMASLGGQTARNSALKALRGFLAWSVRMDYTDAATVEAAIGGRKYRQGPKRRKHFIPVSQFGVMLTLADAEHPWNRAVLGFALFTLTRQSEMAHVRFEHVNLVAGEVDIWREKRDRWTKTPIGPDLRAELDTWLAWYAKDQDYPSPAAMMAAHPDWYLLPALVHRMAQDPVTGMFAPGPAFIQPTRKAPGLERVVKTVLDALGAEGLPGLSVRHLGEGMHTVRRSGAMALFRQLADEYGRDRALFQVGAMLDHEDPQVMTPRYLDLNADRDEVHDFIRRNRMYEPSLAATMPSEPRRLALVR